MHFLLFLIIVCVYILVSYEEGCMNEWWWKKEVNTLLHILTEKTTVNTMQIQCLLLADGTKPLNIQIPQPLLKQLVYRSSIESSFDWFDSPSQVKRKKKAKAKNNQNFDTMMSNEFSFIFISTLDFRHTVQYCIFNIRTDWFDL